MLVEKRREKLKDTATRDVTNGRQGKNVVEVMATKKAAERRGLNRSVG